MAIERAAVGRFSWLRLTVAVTIGVVLLALALRDVRLEELDQAILAARLPIIGVALANVFLTISLKVFRWKLLFYPQHRRLRFSKLLSAMMIGQTTNAFLPARAGDVARVLVLGQLSKMSRTYILGTVVLEKLLDGLMLLIFAGTTFPLVPLPGWVRPGAYALSVGCTLALILSFVIALRKEDSLTIIGNLLTVIPGRAARSLEAKARSGADSLDALGRKGIPLSLLGVSVAIWILSALTNYLVLLAFDFHLSAVAPIVLLVVLQLGALPPSSPAKIGVFHAICVATLGMFGVDNATALAYAVILHVLVYGPMAGLGVASMWHVGFVRR